MTNFPPPDYDRAVDAHLAPTGPAPSERPAPQRAPRKRALGIIAALALVLGPAIAGYAVGEHRESSSGGSAVQLPSSNAPVLGSPNGSSNGANGSSNGSSSTSGSSGRVDVDAVVDKADDSVVNINTTLDGGAAAGTGIIISSSGLVLTNNHVIADSKSIRVEVVDTGKTYAATVLGYNIVDDVAVIQLQDVSGLKAADIGSSEHLAIGDVIVALGNAGGVGGQPTTAAGSVIAKDQQITASESDGSRAQVLSDLIQVNANIRAGDSGGPLVDENGAVVGMNAAASSRNGLGGFPSAGGQNEGYAIPIEKAMAIAKKIVSKEGGENIHVGANRALIGVKIVDDSSSTGRSGGLGGLGGGRSTGNGAVVSSEPDAVEGGAAKAGISPGSTITAVDGVSITSSTALTKLMVQYQPDDKIDVTWIDPSGSTHRATVALGSGPPA
jgi:S1-C subfamily serine protease